MGALEFKGLSYPFFSEIPFKDESIHISNYDNEVTTWLISEYITHLFGMEIVDIFTC